MKESVMIRRAKFQIRAGLKDVTRCYQPPNVTYSKISGCDEIFCSGVTFDDKTEFRVKSDFCCFKSPKTVTESPKLRFKSLKTIRFVENSVDLRNLLKKLV
jgi:hypothetical protein